MQNNEPNSNDPLNLSKGTQPPANNPYETPTSTPPNAPSFLPPVAPAPPPTNAVSTDVIGQSWELLKPQIGMWIVALLIYGAISGAFNGISTVISLAGGSEPSVVVSLLSFIVSVASFLVGLLASAGLMKMAIHHVRSGQADISKLFDITDVIAPVLIAGVLYTLAIVLGFVACIIPGVIVALGLSMYIPLIVDQKADAIESIKRSWEVCKPHLGALFLLYFVLGLVNIAGACACFIGLFVTVPMTQIALALTYRNLFGVGASESAATAPQYPPPPIANPQ